MDNVKMIAISQIASVLSETNMLVPSYNLWEKIFNNAGLKEYYEEYEYDFKCDCVQINWTDEYSHNERCYSKLNFILNQLVTDFESFLKFINIIAEEINLNEIFSSEIDTKRKDKLFQKKNINELERILLENPSRGFKKLRSNLNILGLDFSFDKEFLENLVIYPFEFINKSESKTILNDWLNEKYPNIANAYESAIKSYSVGDSVATLTHCRNIITGILSYRKSDDTKWLTGLQTACFKDKNLDNITKPNNIPKFKYVKRSDIETEEEYQQIKIENKYNYPRFKTIYQIYSYLSDLGPHIAEATLNDNIPNCESAELPDALMGLRFTEDILIWLYQNEF